MIVFAASMKCRKLIAPEKDEFVLRNLTEEPPDLQSRRATARLGSP